jgi:hypothetical protein
MSVAAPLRGSSQASPALDRCDFRIRRGTSERGAQKPTPKTRRPNRSPSLTEERLSPFSMKRTARALYTCCIHVYRDVSPIFADIYEYCDVHWPKCIKTARILSEAFSLSTRNATRGRFPWLTISVPFTTPASRFPVTIENTTTISDYCGPRFRSEKCSN